jgi:acyl-CoA hydrolase
VEAGFIAAASLTKPENIVCQKIHGMTFSRPVKRGEVIQFRSKIVLAGKSRLVAFIEMSGKAGDIIRGFITFVHVDLEGQPLPHGLVLVAETDEDKALQAEAKALQ